MSDTQKSAQKALTQAGDLKCLQSRNFIIRDLFRFALEAYRKLYRLVESISSPQCQLQWNEERGRLMLWGDGFAVLAGELDITFLQCRDKHLRESAILSLCNIVKALACYESQCGAKPSLLLELAEFTKTVRGQTSESLGLELDLDLDDWPESSSESAISEIVEDLRDAIDCLYDLVPSIEELFLSRETTKVEIQTIEHEVEVTQQVLDPPLPSQHYALNIQDKFPKIEQSLAALLGEINWARHQRIRQWIAAQEEANEAESEVVKPALTAPPEKDSGLGDSVFTSQTPIPPTHDNPLPDTRSEISATSFGTANSSVSGHARVPRPPVPLTPGVKFECNICFRQLVGVDTKILWKKHALRDLQPYSCLFTSCPERGKTFGSRRLWVAHEFKNHRPQYTTHWHCSHNCGMKFAKKDSLEHHILHEHLDGKVTASDISDIVARCEHKSQLETIQCPFCSENIKETKASIQLHIGTHMDEIALKALPLCDDDSSSVSSEASRFTFTARPVPSRKFNTPVPSDAASSPSPEIQNPGIGDDVLLLHTACARGDVGAVEMLLQQDSNPALVDPIHARNNMDYEPIHVASAFGHLDIVKLLVQHGARLDMPSGPHSMFRSPLLLAVAAGHIAVVQYLLENGADPWMPDSEGKSFLDIAREKDLSLVSPRITPALIGKPRVNTLENYYLCPFTQCSSSNQKYNPSDQKMVVAFKEHLVEQHGLKHTDLINIPTFNYVYDGDMCSCGTEISFQSHFWMPLHNCVPQPAAPVSISQVGNPTNSTAAGSKDVLSSPIHPEPTAGTCLDAKAPEPQSGNAVAPKEDGQEKCLAVDCKKGSARRNDLQAIQMSSCYTRMMSCPYCASLFPQPEFTSLEQFKEHITSHFMKQRIEFFKCGICSTRYEPRGFYDHVDECLYVHFTGEKLEIPLSNQDRPRASDLQPCTVCNRFYYNIEAHRLMHELGRPEKCPIPSCIYSKMGFVRKRDCIQHTLGHNQALMTCPFCAESEAKRINKAESFMSHMFMEHIKRGRGSSVGHCNLCEDVFTAQGFYDHLEDCLVDDTVRRVLSTSNEAATSGSLQQHEGNQISTLQPSVASMVSDASSTISQSSPSGSFYTKDYSKTSMKNFTASVKESPILFPSGGFSAARSSPEPPRAGIAALMAEYGILCLSCMRGNKKCDGARPACNICIQNSIACAYVYVQRKGPDNKKGFHIPTLPVGQYPFIPYESESLFDHTPARKHDEIIVTYDLFGSKQVTLQYPVGTLEKFASPSAMTVGTLKRDCADALEKIGRELVYLVYAGRELQDNTTRLVEVGIVHGARVEAATTARTDPGLLLT